MNCNMYTESRETEVQLHKKAKKSSCNWVCPACGEIYRTIGMLKGLPDE